MNNQPAFRLRLLGSPLIVDRDGVSLRGPATQRHRVALLALLARSPGGGLGRETISGYLWPERGAEQARRLLNQAVYKLRNALGDAALLSNAGELRLNAGVVGADVGEFEAARAGGDHARAVEVYAGPFLDGFGLSDAPEFERWAERERERLTTAFGKTLEALAEAADRVGDVERAVGLWQRRAAHDPYDSRVALQLIRALDAGGNRAGALRHARVHEQLLREELGIAAPSDVQALVARLQRESVVGRESLPELPPPVPPTATTSDVAGPSSAASSLVARPLVPVPAARDDPPEPRVALVSPARSTADTPAPDTPRPTAGPASGEPGQEPRGEPHVGQPTPPAGGWIAPPWRRLRPAVRVGVAVLAVCAGVAGLWQGSPTQRLQADARERAPVAEAGSLQADPRSAPAGGSPGRRPATRSVAAYDLYRRGSDRTRLRSDSAAEEGIALLEQAIALDSAYAAAWAALALLHHRVGLEQPPRSRARHQRLAAAAARTAAALDDSLADAHLVLAKVQMAAFDFAAAERQLARAAALNPTDPEPHELLVSLHLWLGRPAEAMAHADRAVALAPLSPAAHAERARALLGLDRCEEALGALAQLAHVRPPLLRAPYIAAQCYARTGAWPAALAALQPQAERNTPTALALTAYLLARDGRPADARRIHATLRDRWQRGEVGAFQVGLGYAGLGELDRAVAWFERAVADGSLHGSAAGPCCLMLVVPGPLADDLRDHAGFARLRRRLGIAALARGRTRPALPTAARESGGAG